MEDRTCPGCGEVIVPHERERNRKVWCSIACRSRHKRRTDPDYVERERIRNSKRSQAMPPRMVEARAKARRAARGTSGKGARWAMGHCDGCSAPFTAAAHGVVPRFCSKRCKRRAIMERRRARISNAYVADVNRTEIFERDRWICQLCHGKVNKTLTFPDLMCASLDHIVPLASGGTHEPANCQLAHFICNSSKSDGCGGEQLRLVG